MKKSIMEKIKMRINEATKQVCREITHTMEIGKEKELDGRLLEEVQNASVIKQD